MRLTLPLAAAVLFVFAACRSDQPVPRETQSFAGVYVYKSVDTSVDRATDHQLDRLTLRPDGTYLLVQGGSTKTKSETTGVWRLVWGRQPNIELDHAGYPVEMNGNEIRLGIDDDLGEWYVKTQ